MSYLFDNHSLTHLDLLRTHTSRTGEIGQTTILKSRINVVNITNALNVNYITSSPDLYLIECLTRSASLPYSSPLSATHTFAHPAHSTQLHPRRDLDYRQYYCPVDH